MARLKPCPDQKKSCHVNSNTSATRGRRSPLPAASRGYRREWDRRDDRSGTLGHWSQGSNGPGSCTADRRECRASLAKSPLASSSIAMRAVLPLYQSGRGRANVAFVCRWPGGLCYIKGRDGGSVRVNFIASTGLTVVCTPLPPFCVSVHSKGS
jgi:hypothetical protein